MVLRSLILSLPTLFGKRGTFHPFPLAVGILSPLIFHYHFVNLIIPLAVALEVLLQSLLSSGGLFLVGYLLVLFSKGLTLVDIVSDLRSAI